MLVFMAGITIRFLAVSRPIFTRSKTLLTFSSMNALPNFN
jgi:hypothetical protein